VNAWVFFRDLPALAESGGTERVRAAAATCRDRGIQPVDSLVLSPDGALAGAFWVEDVFDYGFEERLDVGRPAPTYEGSPEARYDAFLGDVLARLGSPRFE
jgi:hypothetical protein